MALKNSQSADALIARSSLGEPSVIRVRARTPEKVAEEICNHPEKLRVVSDERRHISVPDKQNNNADS